MMAARSTSFVLPEPQIGAVPPCIGACGSERLIIVVRISDRETDRLGDGLPVASVSSSRTKGNFLIGPISTASAARASSFVGRCGIGGYSPDGIYRMPVAA